MRTDPYKEAEDVVAALTFSGKGPEREDDHGRPEAIIGWLAVAFGLLMLGGTWFVVVHFARKFW